jgi:hypothetical protein
MSRHTLCVVCVATHIVCDVWRDTTACVATHVLSDVCRDINVCPETCVSCVCRETLLCVMCVATHIVVCDVCRVT